MEKKIEENFKEPITLCKKILPSRALKK